MKTGEIARIEEVYDAFKTYAMSSGKGVSVETLVADMHRSARHYCRIALGAEKNNFLAEAFADIRDLKAEVTYPFLMRVYSDFENKLVTEADFLAALRLVESYIFRRTICSIPTNSHNKTFASFGRSLNLERYLDSIQAHFQTLPSYRRFPVNAEFQSALQTRDLYALRVRTYWLRRLENHGRKEKVAVEEYTIEHIMPQNEDLRSEWQADLGSNWKDIQIKYLHTLGNLTLTRYNPELSDRPFKEKRDMKGGFRDTPIRLSDELRHLESWNEATIKARAERLANVAVDAWKAPNLTVNELAAFATEPKASGTFSIEDHPQLMAQQNHALFQDLRSRIAALDPAVLEEARKLYVVYKTETVFVSIIPLANGLRLVLNLPFSDLQDTRGLARDITNIGHWSTGNADLHLTTNSDLAYAMGLVRQAYEWQIDAKTD